MGLVRTFIASELPSQLQDAIQKATTGLRKRLSPDLIKWVPPSNIHLTYRFLGDVSPSSMPMIENMLVTEATRHQAFEVIVKGFGAYPNARRPRVLWVGLVAPPELAALQRDLDMGAATLGYGTEERDFSPHLTVGRVRQNASAGDLLRIHAELEQAGIGDIGSMRVATIRLFKSELQPAGSVYTSLFTARLG